MERRLIIYACICFLLTANPFRGWTQELPQGTEQQLENQTNADEGEMEDDANLLSLEYFQKHPLNINTADAADLKQLNIVTDLQVANLVAYRNLFGNLIHLYELQAVPGWDLFTINRILPFIIVEIPLSVGEEAGKRFRDGDHTLLLRLSQVLERSSGFDKGTAGTKYLGSPQHIFLRYRYTYKNLLQFGIVGDKDAGEQFLKGAQKSGFDFYSMHLFVRKTGRIETLALGDFSVSMGQGLIQWQGMAFKKSSEVMAVKRQSALLRPYSSAGEFYFHRGAGITIRKDKLELSTFISMRKLGANLETGVDNEDHVSSFLVSGYHRTANENEERNNLRQTALGSAIVYRAKKGHVGLNGMIYKFSSPINKRDEPYNLYAISGTGWYNWSIDYGHTYKNLHFFGEAAVDKQLQKAFVNGLLVSVDPRVDLSVVLRAIGKGYQALGGNAFTENVYPTNENGIYTGITIRPVSTWKIDVYADIYKFPWLKYMVDAPSSGTDYLAQISYLPSRQIEIYMRFRTEKKQSNQADNITVTNNLVSVCKQSWRVQVSYKINKAISLRNRVELNWYNDGRQEREKGFIGFFDLLYKPMMKPFSVVGRLQYFETDGYDSRVYAYENDIRYSYSIPALFDKGFRYYITLNHDLSKRLSCWARWAQTIYKDKNSVGTGLDEVPGNRKTEVKFQVTYVF